MQKITRKSVFNALFLIVIFSLTILSVFKGEDLRELWQYLSMADVGYVLPGIAFVVLFIFGEASVILYLLHTLGTKVSFGHCCLYSFIGFFYSGITPSASGGQPMQVVAMRKDRIPVAVSTVVLAIVTITYKLVLVVIGLTVMALRPECIMEHLDGIEGLVHLGLTLNVGCIVLLFMLVFSPSLVRRGAEAALGWLHRKHFIRHPEKADAKLEEIMSQYTGAADYYRNHKVVIGNVFVLTLLQRACLFLVTWFAYKALGLSGENLITVATLQAMISVMVDMLPTPGGMGFSENLFMKIFLPIFGAEMVLPGLVLSRGISYYTQLLLSGVMTIAAAFMIRKHD